MAAAVKWSGWDLIVAGSRVQRLRQTFASGSHGAFESKGPTAFVQLTDKPPQPYRYW
jgi:hypothetical protein